LIKDTEFFVLFVKILRFTYSNHPKNESLVEIRSPRDIVKEDEYEE